MSTPFIDHLVHISAAVAERPDYVQGGGGNTSAKDPATGLMAIKASGYELRALTPVEGYAVLGYPAVQGYFDTEPDFAPGTDPDAVLAAYVKQQVQDWEGRPALRPSMETGFHSLLGRCVIHTHSVYANVITCAQEGESWLNEVFLGSPWKPIWIRYFNPGYWLTQAIQQALRSTPAQEEQVIFLQNHGLIVSASTPEATASLHEAVNAWLQARLGLDASLYALPQVSPDGQGHFQSATPWLQERLRAMQTQPVDFEGQVLFPDQTVFFNGNIAWQAQSEKKISLDLAQGNITYRCAEKEARTIEETFCAYLYIREQVLAAGKELRFISQADIDYIQAMESEAYRKSLLRQAGQA